MDAERARAGAGHLQARPGEATPARSRRAARAGRRSHASPSKAAPPPPPAIPGLSEAKLRALYDEYLGAKKRCGEDVSRFTYETLARTVAKQVPELIARYAAKTVDFRVEVKDGRAVLKVLPRV